MTASDAVSRRLAPMPCAARARFSISADVASPQSPEATVNTTMPISMANLRPCLSAYEPAASRRAANVRMYALTTHSMSAKDAPSDLAIDGKATATMFESSMITDDISPIVIRTRDFFLCVAISPRCPARWFIATPGSGRNAHAHGGHAGMKVADRAQGFQQRTE